MERGYDDFICGICLESKPVSERFKDGNCVDAKFATVVGWRIGMDIYAVDDELVRKSGRHVPIAPSLSKVLVDVNTLHAGVGAISATFVARNGSLVTRAGILLLFKPDTISNE
ncbi:hypothetical protein DEO72_LG1g1644 [Vigna unguiculata]|uniref:Uncharacterized protein n=1 Tax=Vigna unguiculata TaxID=3917 RepID=A0A4D6KN79_VIGUN|nr:hypothetical protein DEO72_LG1g1644 [Vigna unguiculata]